MYIKILIDNNNKIVINKYLINEEEVVVIGFLLENFSKKSKIRT